MMDKQSRIIVPALGVLVAVLGIAVIWQQIAGARLSARTLEQKDALAKIKAELRESADSTGSYEELALKLGGRLPACTWSQQMPFMITQMTGIVESHGLKVQSLRPEPMSSSNSIARFPLELELNTGLRELTQVLKDIEDTVPLLDIERMDVRHPEGGSDKLQVTMTVSSFVVLDKSATLTERRSLPNVEKTVEEKLDENTGGDNSDEQAKVRRVESDDVSLAAETGGAQ